MSRLWAAVTTVALIGWGTPTNTEAQTVYVIDHLAVGIHQEKSLESPIARVVPTGTRLEILAKSGNLVQVKTEDGALGWVDETYLMQEKPAQLALLEATDQLEVARAKIESLTLQLESMASVEQVQASAEETTSGALREMQRLAEENQNLKLELAELIATRNSEADETQSSSMFPTNGQENLLGLGMWHWVLIGALMLLSFGVGGYFIDWSSRRRHGGFRI